MIRKVFLFTLTIALCFYCNSSFATNTFENKVSKKEETIVDKLFNEEVFCVDKDINIINGIYLWSGNVLYNWSIININTSLEKDLTIFDFVIVLIEWTIKDWFRIIDIEVNWERKRNKCLDILVEDYYQVSFKWKVAWNIFHSNNIKIKWSFPSYITNLKIDFKSFSIIEYK